MEALVTQLVTIFCSVAASSGFWAFMSKRTDTKDGLTQLVLGLAHDRIVFLAMRYIERGWLTKEEYDNLHKYLYTPYLKIGGNGTAARVMAEVDKLPVRPSIIREDQQ